MSSTLISLALSSVSTGLSSLGAYTFGRLTGFLNPIPAVDAFIGQILSYF